MLKIRKIKEPTKVYDITVEDNHNFFADDVLVHNCTEILLHTKPTRYGTEGTRKIKEYGETAVCNLGSLNLNNHLTEDENGKTVIDYKRLEKTIYTAMRMLDNVIDINFYPTKEAQKSNMAHRPVGLGSMGWHDVYHKLGVLFDSDEAVKLSSDLYEFISWHAISASAELAEERGSYPTYEGSLWSQGVFPMDTYKEVMKLRSVRAISRTRGDLDWDGLKEKVASRGMRNSNTMAIAPTATISSIVGCSQSIEPIYSVLFVYSTLSGEFTMINEQFVNDMKKLGIWGHELINQVKAFDGDLTKITSIPDEYKEKYKSSFKQDQFKMIDCAGARQRWIDQGQSLNIYNDQTSLKYLNDLYLHAWNSGLKTTYYLRNQAASKVEKSTVTTTQEVPAEPENIKACSIFDPGCESCQ